jgi:hypothetical protein
MNSCVDIKLMQAREDGNRLFIRLVEASSLNLIAIAYHVDASTRRVHGSGATSMRGDPKYTDSLMHAAPVTRLALHE